MADSVLPMVEPDADSRAFWQEIREHRLAVQKCVDCGSIRAYAQAFCPLCLSERFEWVHCSGSGRVYSFTSVLRPPTPAFASQVPYSLALIDLDEGPRLLARVRDGAGSISIGDRVRAVFDDSGLAPTLPIFEVVK